MRNFGERVSPKSGCYPMLNGRAVQRMSNADIAGNSLDDALEGDDPRSKRRYRQSAQVRQAPRSSKYAEDRIATPMRGLTSLLRCNATSDIILLTESSCSLLQWLLVKLQTRGRPPGSEVSSTATSSCCCCYSQLDTSHRSASLDRLAAAQDYRTPRLLRCA